MNKMPILAALFALLPAALSCTTRIAIELQGTWRGQWASGPTAGDLEVTFSGQKSFGDMTLYDVRLVATGPSCPSGEDRGAGDRTVAFRIDDVHFAVRVAGRTGGRLSLRAGRHETRRLQWESQVTRGRVEEDPLPGAARKVTLTFALVNLVLNFHPRPGLVPYVLAGMGLARTSLDAVGLSSNDTQAGYQIAGGCRFFLGQRSAAAVRI